MALCPGHDDRVHSLSLTHTGERWLLNCHAGCDIGNVLEGASLEMEDLHEEAHTQLGLRDAGPAILPELQGGPRTPSREVASYPYKDETGALLYTVVRFEPKTFRVQAPDGTWGINGARRVLYRLPELLASSKDRWTFIVEGERDVDTLVSHGFIATTSGGATSWRPEYAPHFAGRKVCIIPDNDDAGRRFAETCSRDLKGISAIFTSLLLPNGAKDVSDWFERGGSGSVLRQLVLAAAANPTPAQSEGPIRASALVQEEVSWLWNQRIPQGKITILEGDPGLGKSTLSTEIAATLSTGSSLPSGPPLEPAASLILTAEDGLSDTVLPRLHASGANLDMVHVVPSPISISKDLDKIATWLKDTRARLLIIDPLMAYLGTKVNSWHDQEVRQVLSPLAHLAQTTGTAVLLVRHLTKPPQGKETRNPLYRGGGSIGIIGAARSALTVTESGANHDVRILASIKSNLGKPPLPLYYTLEGAGSVARIKWVQNAEGTVHQDGNPDLALLEEAERIFS